MVITKGKIIELRDNLIIFAAMSNGLEQQIPSAGIPCYTLKEQDTISIVEGTHNQILAIEINDCHAFSFDGLKFIEMPSYCEQVRIAR